MHYYLCLPPVYRFLGPLCLSSLTLMRVYLILGVGFRVLPRRASTGARVRACVALSLYLSMCRWTFDSNYSLIPSLTPASTVTHARASRETDGTRFSAPDALRSDEAARERETNEHHEGERHTDSEFISGVGLSSSLPCCLPRSLTRVCQTDRHTHSRKKRRQEA